MGYAPGRPAAGRSGQVLALTSISTPGGVLGRMGLFDAFRYAGKRVLVVGAATGMGAAVAELVQDAGAEVVVMDIADCTLSGVKSIRVDLSRADSIDSAVDECGGPLHA